MNEFFSNAEIGKAFLTLAQNPEAVRRATDLIAYKKILLKQQKKPP